MANALVRAELAEVWVHFNGDRGRDQQEKVYHRKRAEITEKMEAKQKKIQQLKPNEKDLLPGLIKELNGLLQLREHLRIENDNHIIVTLDYPRSGEKTFSNSKALHIPSGKDHAVHYPAGENFFVTGLFKEVVQGETQIQVSVTDTDKDSAVGKAVRGVFLSVIGKMMGIAVDKIEHSMLNAGADRVKDELLDGAEGSETHIIGKSRKATLQIRQNGKIEVINQGDGIHFQNGLLTLDIKAAANLYRGEGKDVLKAGENNGQVVLRLYTEPV